ncbi:hypothetical protein [Sulfoacidibacillus thermotolerans]|uniref:hypothetical protein n=1 Tax=Sulfoacidibacillus thermotolerans TaxID=1765684 RepID=UPI0015E7F011|nr:hypothetical protein [Sulfoacidibacillus thermotolerans]
METAYVSQNASETAWEDCEMTTGYTVVYVSFFALLVALAMVFLIVYVAAPNRRWALASAVVMFVIGTVGMAMNLIR